MEPITFTKGHGTGNDFVVIPDPDDTIVLSPRLVAALCDRHFGIGADGVLRVVRAAPTSAAEWFMDYRNADGSIAEMCGNGVRVFARYLVDTGLVATSEVLVDTRSGPVVAVVAGDGTTGADAAGGAVSVTMPTPRVGVETTAVVAGRRLPGVAVDCGNPHLVCLVPPGSAGLTELDLSVPPEVDSAVFPEGANVEFLATPPGEPLGEHHVRMRVHERGVGETLSCGSGACAAAAVVLRAASGAGPADSVSGLVTIDVPGGRLTVSLTGDDCALTGPATLVAHGTIDVDALSP